MKNKGTVPVRTPEEDGDDEAPAVSQRKRFTRKFREEEIDIEDNDGRVEVFVMKALSGKLRDQYLTGLSGRLKAGPGGKQSLQDFDGLQGSLLTKCLIGPDNKYVTLETIQNWPAPTIKGLFDMAKDFSGLDDDAEKKAKNDSEGSD